jgi:hypothetical protein
MAINPRSLGDRRSCCRFLDWLCRIWVIITNRRKGGDPCVYFPERVINRPDPCIYSQFLLMQLKQPVTWDNPDIALFKDGVEQYTYNLTVDTTYDVAITVHNSSAEKEALGTKVAVRWIEFGAGGLVRHPIDDLVANVGRYPATAVVSTTWRTPATPGHYCIEVELTHSDDGNPTNNLGWNNTQVLAAHSEAKTAIRIFNRHVSGPPREQLAMDRRGRVPWNLVEINFDSYVFHDAYGDEANGDVMFAPRPPAWPARVEPRIFHFAPDETYRDVELVVDAPDGHGQREHFNVTALQGGAPLGGVTVAVIPGE